MGNDGRVIVSPHQCKAQQREYGWCETYLSQGKPHAQPLANVTEKKAGQASAPPHGDGEGPGRGASLLLDRHSSHAGCLTGSECVEAIELTSQVTHDEPPGTHEARVTRDEVDA